jgi:3-dehydroquinate synthase
VVGDLAGFVAATYMRGVSFYQAPTSLLAMVDASVGGKTAVDLPAGKNLVGAFWQPRAVVADVATLATLPAREFRQGTVELFKHGLLADASLLSTFSAGWSQELPAELLADAVARSVAVKAKVVAADEREAGPRAHLNLGHTLAHALEAASQQRLAHGDAVAYGLVYAALLARRRGYSDHTAAVYELFNWVAPGPLPLAPFSQLYAYMSVDKKVAQGRVRYVLLRDVGDPLVVSDLTYAELERTYQELLKVVA